MGCADKPRHPPIFVGFRTAPLKQLMKQHTIGGDSWMELFAYGFQITGRLSRRFVCEADADSRARIPREQLFETASARFCDRAANSGFKNAQTLRGALLQMVEKGGRCHPRPCLQAEVPCAEIPLVTISARFSACYRPKSCGRATI